MEIKEYETLAETTAVFDPKVALPYLVSGLCSEAGEVAGKYKKLLRGDEMEDLTGMAKELGDVLWYLAMLSRYCHPHGLDGVARANLDKLASRSQRGLLKGNGDNR